MKNGFKKILSFIIVFLVAAGITASIIALTNNFTSSNNGGSSGGDVNNTDIPNEINIIVGDSGIVF